MFNKEQSVQVSDTTGDAMKRFAGPKNIILLNKNFILSAK